MPSFDIHQHLWPEPFVAELARRHAPPRLVGSGDLRVLELAEEGPYDVDLADHRLDRRLALLDRDGIDVAVVSLQPTLQLERLPEAESEPLVEAYHAGILEIARAAGGRLAPLGVACWRDGFAGACVPADRLIPVPDPLDPVLRDLEREGRVLFVHPSGCARPAGCPHWWPAIVGYTGQMQAAYAAWLASGAEAFPRLRVVFAILAGGAPIQLERLASRGVDIRSALHPHVYFDVASYGRRALELALATFGVRQLVYGSDLPVIDPAPTLAALGSFGDAVSQAVQGENPSLLFP